MANSAIGASSKASLHAGLYWTCLYWVWWTGGWPRFCRWQSYRGWYRSFRRPSSDDYWSSKGRAKLVKIKRNFGICQSLKVTVRHCVWWKWLSVLTCQSLLSLTLLAYPGVWYWRAWSGLKLSQETSKWCQGLKVPVICNVVGEGGSGGALAIGVGDYVNMLQYSTYSVISPEGCASILWRDSDKTTSSRSNGSCCSSPERARTWLMKSLKSLWVVRIVTTKRRLRTLKATLLRQLADLKIWIQILWWAATNVCWATVTANRCSRTQQATKADCC